MLFGLYLISVGWSDWFELTGVVRVCRFHSRQELQDRSVSPPDFPLLLNPSTPHHKVSSPTHCYTEATTSSRSCLVLRDCPFRIAPYVKPTSRQFRDVDTFNGQHTS